jgi:hypothetical protein
MAGAWGGAFAFSEAADAGSVTSSASNGTVVIGSTTTTYAKALWTQIIASTVYDSSWIRITIAGEGQSGRQIAVDIGIGSSGNEVVIISNLGMGSYGTQQVSYMFPFSVPLGTRISARLSSSLLTDNAQVVQCTLFADRYMSPGVVSAIDTYGFNNTTNLGQAVDPGGTANTKGSYAQITAGTSNDIAGFMLMFDTQGQSTPSTNHVVDWLVDLAIGGSGSEVIFLPNWLQIAYCWSAKNYFANGVTPYIPMQIPAGTRIAARAQCNTNASPERVFGLTLYGVRL